MKTKNKLVRFCPEHPEQVVEGNFRACTRDTIPTPHTIVGGGGRGAGSTHYAIPALIYPCGYIKRVKSDEA